jgi:outer membrane lipoprotein-sorting protein
VLALTMLLLASALATAGPGGASSRALLSRLAESGRAVATLERDDVDPLRGETRTLSGSLALEPPDLARLELAQSGEIVTLRSDGGEWLQPRLVQMLRLGPRQAGAARRWWSLLLPGNASRFREVPLGQRRYLVIAGAGGAADSAWVTLDRAGLPSKLRFRDAAGEFVDVRFRGWRFEHGRGRAAFTQSAPAGIHVIDLP